MLVHIIFRKYRCKHTYFKHENSLIFLIANIFMYIYGSIVTEFASY